MNIMKTDMLLLDNKIMKEDAGNTTTPAPVPSTVEPQEGMKALSFMGMQNLMANPKLAQGVGVMNEKVAEKSSADSYVAPYSSNMAFKGGFQGKAKIAAFAALATMAAAALQSCEKDINVSQKQEVIVDTEALAAAISSGVAALQAQISALQAELSALRTQMSQQDAAQAERDQKMIEALQAVINQLTAMNAKIDKQQITFDEFKNMIYGQNSAILDAIVLLQNITKEEAKAQVDRILEAYKNGLIDIKTAMAQIQGLIKTNNELLADIVGILKDLKAAADKANEQRDSLLGTTSDILKYGKASVAQQQMMISQLGMLIYQNNIQITKQDQTIKAIKQTDADLKSSIYDVANKLGVKVDELAEIVVKSGKSLEKVIDKNGNKISKVVALTGKSIEEVMTMSKEEILAILEASLEENKITNDKLVEVNNNINKVNTSVEDNTGAIVDAAQEIEGILNKISAQIDALSAQFADAVDMFRNKLNQLTFFVQGCYANGTITNAQLASLNHQIFDLRNDVKNIKTTAIQIRKNLQDGVAIDYKQLEEMFKILNMHQQASKDEIIAKLDEFIDGQEKIEVAINKLGVENNSKLNYIAHLIKTKTNDNSDVIEAINNLAISNENNIAAATEELAGKLDKLISKVDAILNKMGDIIPVLQQYGDQILAKFDVADDILKAIKANGRKLDFNNMTLAQLKAEVEKIKPELQKLNNSAKTANSYLDIIAKRQLELKEAINNIELIGGNGITKEELEELWQAHDANAFAKAKAYADAIHADDIAKADEIIELMKKGNKTAGDIYETLLNFANKNDLTGEELKALLKAVYEYLPELKCNCNCSGDCNHNDSTHEGIIGIIS